MGGQFSLELGGQFDRFFHSIKAFKGKWSHKQAYENILLSEDKKVSIDEIELICQMNFRYYCYIELQIKDKFYVHFGYDMYMYVGAPTISDQLLKKINSTSVFVEECISPYLSEKLAYSVQRFKKKSNDVLDEFVLKHVNTSKIKEAMKLSDEHPGKVSTKINQRIAIALDLEVDFTKYD